MGWTLAIDFGTTASSVAVRSGDEIELVEVAGLARVPSAVYCTEQGELIAGPQALQLGAARPDLLERNPKRRMGDRSVMLGEYRFTPAQLAASVLRLLASAARAHRGGTQPVQVRITHPASWATTRLGVLTEAAELAGLAAPVLMAEPVAAALHYADARVGPGDLVAVYDLGGGTFDTAVLRRGPDGFALVGPTGGSDRLGGEDFDERLYQFVGDAIAAQDPAAWEQLRYGDTRPWVRANSALRQETQRAKEGLSSAADYTIYVSSPVDQEIRVTREDLERLVSSDIARTVDEMVATVQRSGLQIGDVAAVYLVGGSSRIPLVTRLLAERFGSVPVTWGDPQAAVVLGAAKAGNTTGAPLGAARGRPAGTPAERGVAADPRGSVAAPTETHDAGDGSAGPGIASGATLAEPATAGGPIAVVGGSQPGSLVTTAAAGTAAAADAAVGLTAPDAADAAAAAHQERTRRAPLSQRRRLLPVLLAIAVVVALVTTAVLVFGPGRRAALATAVTLTDLADGDAAMPATRSFAIESGTLTSTVQVRNPAAEPIRRIWIEVVPKSVAADVAQVRFTRDPAGVLAQDPVVYFVVELAPGATDTIGWSVPLPAGAATDQAYLHAVDHQRQQESAAVRTALAAEIDRLVKETGVPVVTGTVPLGGTSAGAPGSELAAGPLPTSPVGPGAISTTGSSTPTGDAVGSGTAVSGTSGTTASGTVLSSGAVPPSSVTTPVSPTGATAPTTPPRSTTAAPLPRSTTAAAPPRTTASPPRTTASPAPPRTTPKTTPKPPSTTPKPAPPTLSFTTFPSSVTLSELVGWSASIAAKASNGATVSISVSGLPAGLSYGGGKVSGTVSYSAATVTTDRRNGINSKSFTVTATATAAGASAISRGFTVTVRDTHRLMPNYVGYYGCGGTGSCSDPASLPNLAAVATPAFRCQVGGGVPETVVAQSVPAGSVIAWGQQVTFTYARSACD